MECPYCKSKGWDFQVLRDTVTEPCGNDDEKYHEYTFALCPDCKKEFVVRDTYVATELGRIMTMEEYEGDE